MKLATFGLPSVSVYIRSISVPSAIQGYNVSVVDRVDRYGLIHKNTAVFPIGANIGGASGIDFPRLASDPELDICT